MTLLFNNSLFLMLGNLAIYANRDFVANCDFVV